jgi:hypothetical protein
MSTTKSGFNITMTFKDYYSSLSEGEKNKIRHGLCPKYMAESTFFYKLRNNAFTALEIEKINELTNLTFEK